MNWLNQAKAAASWVHEKVLNPFFGASKRLASSPAWSWGVSKAKSIAPLSKYATIAEDVLNNVNKAGDIYQQAQTDPLGAADSAINAIAPAVQRWASR